MENEITVPKPDGRGRIIALLIVIALILIGSLCGCRTPKRMLSKFDKLKLKCERRAKTDTIPVFWALREWPLKTVYKPGKAIVKQGKPIIKEVPGPVQYVNCDSLKLAGAETRLVKVPCPPTKTVYITDSVYVHDTVTVEDSRKITLLQAQYVGAMDEASRYKQKYETTLKSLSKWRWVGIVGCGFFLLMIAIIIYANFRKR
jgi:hypothetical protein